MIKKKTWDEFRISGLLWLMNSILHLFGWAIVCEIGDGGKVSEVYPARCKFRGFAEECTSKGYIAVSRYLKENIEELLQEAEADE